MKKFLIMVVMIATGMVGIAHADNYNWTGLYAGVNAGFAFNHVQVTAQQLGFTAPSATCKTSSDFSTFFPGVQVGYMYALPNAFVSGIEADVAVNTNQKVTFSCTSTFNPAVYDRFTFRNQMQTSIKGRVGRVQQWHNNTLLPYVTGGVSFADVGLTYRNEGGNYYSNNATQFGWVIGVGIEWIFRQHWSVRAEDYYLDYRNMNLSIPVVYGLLDPAGNARFNLSSNNFVVAVSYWV